MPTTTAELRRRDALDNAVAWILADDPDSPTGVADPVADYAARTTLVNILTALGQALQVSGTVALDAATLAALENVTATISGTVPVSAASLPLPTGAASQTTLELVLAKLQDIFGAVDGLEVTAENIAINSDAIDLNTDEVEEVLRTIRDNLIAEDFATEATLAQALTTLGVIATALAGTLSVDTGLTPLTDAQLRASDVGVADVYAGGETLADQAGANGVLDFNFSAAVQLVWVMSAGGDVRADPFGGNPSAVQGIPCLDSTPNPITVQTSSIKVYAPAGTTVSVWGYRY